MPSPLPLWYRHRNSHCSRWCHICQVRHPLSTFHFCLQACWCHKQQVKIGSVRTVWNHVHAQIELTSHEQHHQWFPHWALRRCNGHAAQLVGNMYLSNKMSCWAAGAERRHGGRLDMYADKCKYLMFEPSTTLRHGSPFYVETKTF